MRRALVLSPTPAAPADQGNRARVRQMTRLLARAGYAVDFVLYPMDADFNDALPSGIVQRGAGVRAERDGLFVIVPPSRKLHAPPLHQHHELDEWWDPALDAQLAFLSRRRGYAVMWINYAFLSRGFAHAPPGCLRVLDTHDALAGRRELFERHGCAPEFFQLDEAEEARALARADLVVAIKDSEANHFERLGAGTVVTVPALPTAGRRVAPGVKQPRRGSQPGDTLRVGFIGADNAVNAVGLSAFLARLARWRSLLAPALSVVVAGGVCRHITTADGDVTVLGHVADLASFYGAVDVVAAPIVFSTGLKIKVAEALAWGKPVVATADAFDGLPAADPFHTLPDIDAVCAALVELAADPVRLGRLAGATRISAARARAAVRAGEAAIRRQLDRGMPRIVLITDIAFQRRHSLIEERAWQMVGYLASLMPVHVLAVETAVEEVLPRAVTAERLASASDIPAALRRVAAREPLAACIVTAAKGLPAGALVDVGCPVVHDRWPAALSGDRQMPVRLRDIRLPDGRRFATTPLRYLPGALPWHAEAAHRQPTLLVIVEGEPDTALLAALRASCRVRFVAVRTDAMASDAKLIGRLAALPAPLAIATVGAHAVSRELVDSLASWCGAASFHLNDAIYPLPVDGMLVTNTLQHVAKIAAWFRKSWRPTESERSPDAGWSLLWAFLTEAGRRAATRRERTPPAERPSVDGERDAA